MQPGSFFHEEEEGEILARVAYKWEFVDGFPFPRWNLFCPTCRSNDLQYRGHLFWNKGEAQGIPYRCDVSIKCRDCSYILDFGIPLTKEQFDQMVPDDTSHKKYYWREVQEILAASRETTVGGN